MSVARWLPWLVLVGCAPAPAGHGPPSATAARTLAEDTSVTLASGATLTVPKGWSFVQSADTITLADPDRSLRVTISEHTEANALAAIGVAWQRAKPGFALKAGEPDAPPPTGGWDATVRVGYAAPAAERRSASALARRWGGRTWVALVDGDAAAVERRGAQIETALGSLRPAGMKEESFAGLAPRPIDAERARRLDAFVEDTRAKLDVPGVAVAVLQGGKVVYERVSGVRELGKTEPVTPNTLFLLGSITKPMTTLMQAALVDAGVLGWDTPVTRLLPSFELGDPAVTRSVALWHMSCACTGMPRQDFEYIFEYEGVTPEARIASMKAMKPTTGFGETFQYSNLMVAAGGFAAAHAFAPSRPLGEAYAAAMRAKVFEPIGMRSTTLDFAEVARGDHASPHALDIDGKTRILPLSIERNVLPIAPAGAVWSSLADFERYAQTELSRGVSPEGRRVVSEANLMARREVRVRSGASDGYGLGLDVSTLGGRTWVGHDGGAFGYGTTLFLMPDAGLGIVVLTSVRNGGGYALLPFNQAFVREVIEEVFEGTKDIARASVSYYAKARRDAAARASAGVERAPPSAWLAQLAGRYTHPALGAVVIAGATLDAGEWKVTFGRRTEGDATSKLVFLDPPFAGAQALVADDAGHPRLVFDDGQTRYEMTR